MQIPLKKKKENQELKKLFKSVKDILAKKGLLNKERRGSLRLNLSRDFNRTIILRIEHTDKPERIKSFANNVSSGGLGLETKREFEEKDKMNLRLFFYGDQIPMMKIQARIIWKKKIETTNYYGACFDLIEEKDKQVLNHYIESNIRKE